MSLPIDILIMTEKTAVELNNSFAKIRGEISDSFISNNDIFTQKIIAHGKMLQLKNIQLQIKIIESTFITKWYWKYKLKQTRYMLHELKQYTESNKDGVIVREKLEVVDLNKTNQQP